MIRTLRLIYVDVDTQKKRSISFNYAKTAPLAADVQALGFALEDIFADALAFFGADLTERTTTVIV